MRGGSEGRSGAVEDEEVRQVRGSQVVEAFTGEEEEHEADALFNGEPVERVENRRDEFTGLGMGEEAGSRGVDQLDQLEFMEGMGGDSEEGGDKGRNEEERGGVCRGLDDGADMGTKERVGSRIMLRLGTGGGSDGGGVDGE